ncbi:helix-turn-helix domain-containing protein [Dyella ginsengisoli]|uniref:Helix-turn-helix domain-containing protein n=1 Tax=Dyella ginsengisoli TaxID=363848 RepID=A0ABW8JV05_9GAMM
MIAAPLYVGPGTPARCKAAADAVAAKKTQRAAAEEFGVSRSTLRRYLDAAANMAVYAITLERDGSQPLRVCDVLTPKGPLTAAVAAYREYPGTLKTLELPGWKLRVGGALIDLDTVRKASGRAK